MTPERVIAPSATSVDPGQSGWRLEHSYGELPAPFFTHVAPTPVASPKLALLNVALAEDLGLDAAALALADNAGWFTGNTLPPGALPLAQAYAGHQFGNFVMLGDGRAILLGEQLTPRGERFDIQLKGAGRTRYSRGGDGRAALGPMLREYVISEAMHALGIPTTRSLAVAATGEAVLRESALPGAVLTRVALSHLRVGTFEFAAALGDTDHLRALADYAIRRHYREVPAHDQRYADLLEEILKRQAALIAQWQHIGFVHGVMNTDNMAVSGETIDYGPCAFMDAYHLATVFSSIDRHGRYAYANQPKIAHWNLSRLAAAMLPLLHADEDKAVDVANEILMKFPGIYQKHWLQGLRAKLGLFNEEPEDAELGENLLAVMQEESLDFTNTFRELSRGTRPDVLSASARFLGWHARWQKRLSRQTQDPADVQALMQRHNPAFIPRNHKVEEALSAATEDGDLNVVTKLNDVLAQPFAYDRELAEFSTPSPESGAYQTFCGT